MAAAARRVNPKADRGNRASGRLLSSTPAKRGSASAMSKTTRATLALTRLGIKFALHTYEYDSSADRIGRQAAQALGIEPQRMLKTLMAEVDGKPVCVVVPSDREVSMKKLAAAFRGNAANMMRPADAERLTGFHVGGISPFAPKKRVPVAIDQAALAQTSVYLNGGQRGLQIEIDPNDALRALDAIVLEVTG
jgi:Cys-tRNA(Pro)/Cys-tRNA(Cys) deacylase